jgi:hypothetical protein
VIESVFDEYPVGFSSCSISLVNFEIYQILIVLSRPPRCLVYYNIYKSNNRISLPETNTVLSRLKSSEYIESL